MKTAEQFSDMFNINIQKQQIPFLTADEIRSCAPIVYATEPTNPGLSKYYTFASTEKVIEDMKKLGWEVIFARQPRARRTSVFHSYHMIIFRNANPDYKITYKNIKGEDLVYYPEIILTNSHDGFSSFRFEIAISSELNTRIFVNNFNCFRIRHMGYSFDELQQLINDVMQNIPTQIEVMNNMHTRILTETEKQNLALAVLRDRKNDPELKVPTFILDEILEPEDENAVEPTNLWETMVIINKKMMDGNFSIPNKNGKLRRARKITGIWKYIHHGRAIFSAAASLL